jgi:hypothetical protein
MNKKDDDNWITHDGGNSPVDIGTVILIKLRNNLVYREYANDILRWNHTGLGSDIIGYKLADGAT